MDMGKNGYTALISGGSSEIGLGIATTHALEGIHLATASRTSTRDVLEELRTYGVDVNRFRDDVSIEEQVVF